MSLDGVNFEGLEDWVFVEAHDVGAQKKSEQKQEAKTPESSPSIIPDPLQETFDKDLEFIHYESYLENLVDEFEKNFGDWFAEMRNAIHKFIAIEGFEHLSLGLIVQFLGMLGRTPIEEGRKLLKQYDISLDVSELDSEIQIDSRARFLDNLNAPKGSLAEDPEFIRFVSIYESDKNFFDYESWVAETVKAINENSEEFCLLLILKWTLLEILRIASIEEGRELLKKYHISLAVPDPSLSSPSLSLSLASLTLKPSELAPPASPSLTPAFEQRKALTPSFQSMRLENSDADPKAAPGVRRRSLP